MYNLSVLVIRMTSKIILNFYRDPPRQFRILVPPKLLQLLAAVFLRASTALATKVSLLILAASLASASFCLSRTASRAAFARYSGDETGRKSCEFCLWLRFRDSIS